MRRISSPTGRAAGLAHSDDVVAALAEPLGEQPKLRALPRAFGTLEDDEAAGRHRWAQPSVMIELVAPFSMPSRIQSFTLPMVLSKFSCATSKR